MNDPRKMKMSSNLINSELYLIKNFFDIAKGKVPMCCTSMRVSKEIISCDFYQGTPEIFKEFCLGCQSYIEEKILMIERKLSEFEQNLS
jgi:hypothetical protein